MNRLTRITATVASSACLIVGFAGVAGASANITGTGNYSTNSVSQTDRTRTSVTNHAKVRAVNNNPQYATTGTASLDNNRDGGNVATGTAANASVTTGAVGVNYSAGTAAALVGVGAGTAPTSSTGTVSDTGNYSLNTVTASQSVKTTVNNNSNVRVVNNNTQTAVSGNASANNNRDAGTVTSGNASNSSVTTFDVNVAY